MSVTDTHCHLYWSSFDGDRGEVLERARAAGVQRMVVVGTEVETSRAAAELAAQDEDIWCSAGIHPHDAEGADAAAREAIRALASGPRCVAVGETGLDWFKEFSPRQEQLESFAWHLDLAAELDKPVIVHCRDAHEATAELVTSHALRRGVMHCYAYGPDELQPYLEAGYFVSFSGVVTYPRNEANREAARQVPLDRLLVETDSPFLAPQGHRGKRNEPALVVPILERVAELRGMTPGELAEVTSANASRLFGLPNAEA